MRERQAIIRELAPKFRQAKSKKERSQIVDQCVSITGYTRWYATYALRLCGKEITRIIDGQRVVFIPGHARSPGSPRKRKSQYNSPALLEALKYFWALSDGLCGKRLVAFIAQTFSALKRDGELPWLEKDPALGSQLLRISAATLDRLLATTKAKVQLKGRSTTRPGTLLKYHIPVRTHSDWNEHQPGFCEADLVAHDGGSAYGDFIQSLNLVDIATCWTEPIAVQNKAQCHVFAALQQVRQRLPFKLLGLDSDNGSEFINHQLVRYCDTEKISFTRSRPYRKNDNCFVEQKNYSIIRRTVAYYRYDSPEQLALLNEFYLSLRLYVNFFQPVMKLTEKIRTGSHLTRRYDVPKTPYHRLLDHSSVEDSIKDALTQQYHLLHLVELKRTINGLQARLFSSAIDRKPPRIPAGFPNEQHRLRRSNNIVIARPNPPGPSKQDRASILTKNSKT
ncbi:MAG TPA: transposase family protein [Bacteroidota bacterium]|jgi:hypothetical protein|nr:transposase family protein [Bacteroidota bacterium]